MPKELIYTSAPQGVDPGRSGYCTVARSRTMGESLIHNLEQLSYYERLSEHGGTTERIVFAFRNLNIRGKDFHVLSRITDAPADYTGRTNFIAHHLVFTPDELAEMPVPPVIFLHWPDWKNEWSEEPMLLDDKQWQDGKKWLAHSFLPADTWKAKTGAFEGAAGLLGVKSGVFKANPDQFGPETILKLLSETLDLLQLNGSNWRSLAWQRTFSVGCQPQDNPADFRWRFLTSGCDFESGLTNAALHLDLRKLPGVSDRRQIDFAQNEPADPKFTRPPMSPVQIHEGETLVLECEAQSLPGEVKYEWYRLEKREWQKVNETDTGALQIPDLVKGTSKYLVRAKDKVTNRYIDSEQITVEATAKPTVFAWKTVPSAASISPIEQSHNQPKQGLGSGLKKANRSRSEHNPRNDGSADPTISSGANPTNTFLLLSLVFLLLIGTFTGYLFYKGFFDPHLGFGHLADRWALKISKNPVAFSNHPAVSEKTKTAIRNFKTITQSRNRDQWQSQLLEIIEREIERRSTKPDSDFPAPSDDKPEPAKPELKPRDTAESITAPVREYSTKETLLPIFAILADGYWKSSIKLLEDNLEKLEAAEKKATNAAVARIAEKQKPGETQVEGKKGEVLKKAEEELPATTKAIADYKRNTLEPNRNRKALAGQIDFPKPWPYFPTNGSPTLRWASLGQPIPASYSSLPGEWRTNAWQFKADKWSVVLSSNRVTYLATNHPGALRASISVLGGAEALNERIELVLFSPNANKTFRVQVVDDNLLKPGDDLWDLLAGLSLPKNNPLRLIGTYSKLKIDRPMTNTLTEIQEMNRKADQWRLGIKQQLTDDLKRAERLKKIKLALDRVDTFWKKVRKISESYLTQSDFEAAFGTASNTELQKSFWNQLNHLCFVAIFKNGDKPKQYSLDDGDEDAAWKKLQNDMRVAGSSGEEFQADLKQLTEDLRSLKDFWSETKYTSGKHYDTAKSDLSNDIKELEKKGSAMELGSLQVDLQFEALQGGWLTITRLNCVP